MVHKNTLAQNKKSGFSNKFTLVIGGCSLVFIVGFIFVYLFDFTTIFTSEHKWIAGEIEESQKIVSAMPVTIPVPVLNFTEYDTRMLALAHRTATTTVLLASSTASSTIGSKATTTLVKYLWPAKTVYPNVGAILPFKRIVAYYGNFYSKGMGVLGEYPQDQMLSMLQNVVAQWTMADPNTPAIPAIDYIAVTAQGSPGADGKYKLRMPDSQIDYALQLAAKVNGIVILDVQVGLSDLPTEIPLLKKYLSMPQVHLAIDPEFAMHNGEKPGGVIGTMDATDVNYVIKYLSMLVDANNLPPKILIVHRFTEDMMTDYKQIKPSSEVQVVMDMDGWGSPAKKKNTYLQVIGDEPIQFTGFKLFYKNDLFPPSTRMMTPEEILKLTPSPVFIQYQ